jgi:phage N-6-adenine-methyltransferase
MDTKLHFSSKTDLWSTPQDTYNELNAKYGPFTLDVCATDENAKCNQYFTQEEDGLSQDWGKNCCWMNPPYGRTIKDWMKKAYESAGAGATVVCLVPSLRGNVTFIRGRLKFGGSKTPAPFPSAVVVFRGASAAL